MVKIVVVGGEREMCHLLAKDSDVDITVRVTNAGQMPSY